MFYIIERKDQLQQLESLGDCFVRFIPKSNNFHPALTDLSLIYIRSLNQGKGYILCLDHTESFSLDKNEIFDWLNQNTNKLWVIDKKKTMYWFTYPGKLFDINFLELIENPTTSCTDYYYNQFSSLSNINSIIPISKHYEESELLFNKVLPITKQYSLLNTQFQFQNFRTTNVFYQIEKNGIKLDKECFINYYRESLKHPEFNLYKGRIYTQYNLYTTTSRPSNTFNSINFAALNKDNGERTCYKPENDTFIEVDFQGYHPRLIGEMIGFSFLNNKNTYETLATVLDVTPQEAKELTFKQLYGGVWSEYQNKPFFKDVIRYVDDLWDDFQYGKCYKTENKVFIPDKDITLYKLFNYVIQSKETSTNVELLELVLDYLKDKKTKIVLYTYDAFLFDYAQEDGLIFQDIAEILQYPISIKHGKSYHGLTKI